jgi:ABC-type glycerol-3-phosphate transport system substrate-binding protein
MLRSKLSPIFAGLFSLALILTACARGESEQPKATPAAQVSPTPVRSQVLLIWHSYQGVERETLEQVSASFKTTHPDIDIRLEFQDESSLLDRYTSAVNRGEGPDLLLGPAAWILVLAQQGAIQPVNPVPMREYLPQSLIDAVLVDNTPYGMPFSAELALLYYNRTLVQAPPVTYDSLIAQAGVSGLIVVPTFAATSGFYFRHNGQLADAQGNSLITQETLLVYLSDLQALAQAPGVTVTAEQELFLQGQAGMFLASSELIAPLQAGLGDQLGVAPMPIFNSGEEWKGLISVQAAMININSTAEVAGAADTFLTFLIAPDSQLLWFEKTHHTPVDPSGLSDYTIRLALGRSLASGIPVPLAGQFNTQMQPLLDQAVRAVMVDSSDPQSVLLEILAVP